MSSDARVEVRPNLNATAEFHDAIARAVTDVFVYDVWPAAVEGSPVAPGKTRGGSYVGGGTNRRSITVEVSPFGGPGAVVGGQGNDKDGQPFDTTGGVAQAFEAGVAVAVFTQSGYGGYLEVGTRFMGARPYIFPAVERFVPTIGARARGFIEAKGE